MASSASFDHLFKIVLVGDSGVGKSNLLSRFTRSSFSSDEKSTIGVEFATRIVTMSDQKNIKMQVWDTAGQERYRAITNAYYRGALGALLVYDCTSLTSFNNISRWLRELRDHANRDVVLMIVGNKKDLCTTGLREVSEEQAESLSQELDIPFLETSAKNGEGVEEAFVSVAKRIYQAAFMNKSTGSGAVSSDLGTVEVNAENSNASQEKKKCCS